MHRGHGGKPGHAVVAHGPPEPEWIELRRDDDRASRGEGRERRCHETMDVEQRHGAQRHIVRLQVVGPHDVADRNRKIGVLERHALGPSRAAARMENQGDIVRGGSRSGALGAAPRQPHLTVRPNRRRTRGHLIACGLARLVPALGGNDEQLRVRVFQEETKLLFPITRIERSGGPGSSGAKKARYRQTVLGAPSPRGRRA